MTELILLILVAIIAGLIGSVFGVGGGIILVPLLVFIFNIPIRVAAGISIVSIIATSLMGSSVYLKNEITNVKIGAILQAAMSTGSIIGALISVYTSEEIISLAFSFMLFYASYMMIRSAQSSDKELNTSEGIASKLKLDGTFLDKSEGRIVNYGVKNLVQGFFISILGGMIAGMLGVGGGLINVPVISMLMGAPIKVAIATSNFIIGITAVSGSIVYFIRGLVNPLIVAPVVIGIVIGAFIGANYMPKIRNITLKRLFSLYLIYTAVRLILRSLGIPIPF
ncbi:MAG: sulfite exporter TauE/SafE family protein [Thermoprotei archaeon]|jgi:uncharacterized membrane protein YfcA